jgi:uncharacterized protein (TIGR00369 family)
MRIPAVCQGGIAGPPLPFSGRMVYKEGMSEFNDNENCFVCGRENPAGLRLEFRTDPGRGAAAAAVEFPACFQGWQDTVHGGLLATVLDETMIKAAAAAGHKCVSAEITVTYRQPARTGARYLAEGEVLQSRGRLVLAASRVRDAAGRVCAQATGKLFKVE